MLNISLNLIGIVLILYSIFIIKNDLLKNNLKIEDLTTIEKNVKNYHDSTNDIILSFNELIELKLEKIDDEKDEKKDNELNKDNKSNKKEYNVDKKEDKLSIDSKDDNNRNDELLKTINKREEINPIHEKVIELLEIGLTKEEIAKRMNKGIREIEIIIKMHKN